MSSDADGRDLEAELDAPNAGQSGIPVDAVCIGCKRTSVRRAPVDSVEDVPSSFRHVCGGCRKVTWWNVVSVLHGLIDAEEDGDKR
ncbi:hypothetical protein [Haloprofundus halobius]|uniref:hypothetical protein n=1 Tax=Haloprofundus halobius TaxID=2876194 RepID=UPI001CC9C924|nr:hypothetical protein [Haloprofundus halobius]